MSNHTIDMHARWADRQAQREQHLAQMRAELMLANDFAAQHQYMWADLCNDLAVLNLEAAIRGDRT